MPFKFTGDSSLLYPQYFDQGTGRPLLADPGGTYDMEPAGSWQVPVPPADGRWESPPAGESEGKASKAAADLPPALLITGTGTEDEEN